MPAYLRPLFLGFTVQAPVLAEVGSLNSTIWNGVRCGAQPCHVPPMLFTIYLVWGVGAIMLLARVLSTKRD